MAQAPKIPSFAPPPTLASPYFWGPIGRGLREGVLTAMQLRLQREQAQAQREAEEWQRRLQERQLALQEQQLQARQQPVMVPVPQQWEALGYKPGTMLPADVYGPLSVVYEAFTRTQRPTTTEDELQTIPDEWAQRIGLVPGVRYRPQDIAEAALKAREDVPVEVAEAATLPQLRALGAAYRAMGQTHIPVAAYNAVAGALPKEAQATLAQTRAEAIQQEYQQKKALYDASWAEPEQVRQALVQMGLPNPVIPQPDQRGLVNLGQAIQLSLQAAEAGQAVADIGLTQAQTALTEARTALTQAQTEAQEIKNYIERQFALPMAQARLQREVAEAAREQIGVQMDRAEWERFTQLTVPVVQKAIAEAVEAEARAGKAQLDLRFSQETFETMVAKVNQELENLRNQGRLQQAEYDRYVQLTPVLVATAYQDLFMAQEQLEGKRLENQWARETLQARVAEAALESGRIDLQIQHIDRTLENLRSQLALAKRAGDTARAQTIQSQIDIATQQRNALLQQFAEAQRKQTALGRLSADDPDVAWKLYELDVEQFREAGLWVPSYLDWLDFWTSGRSSSEWPEFVRQYHQRMVAVLGRAPEDRHLPWMDPVVQAAYKADRDTFYAKFPHYTVETAPEFPPAAVWYANHVSPNPLPLDELVRRWNAHINGEPVEVPGVTRPSEPTAPAPSQGTGSTPVSTAVDTLLRATGTTPEEALREIEALTDAQRQQLAAHYGVPLADLLAELRRRVQGGN